MEYQKQTKAMPGFRKTAETFTSGAKTLPQRYVTSAEVFAKEQERIFSTQRLCVGHQSQPIGHPYANHRRTRCRVAD